MDQNSTVPAPLPVIQTIRKALQFVWDKRVRMVRALFLPAVAIGLLELSPTLTSVNSNDPAFWNSALLGGLTALALTLPYVLFAITCHRLVLIGDPGVPDYGLLKWTKRESRYLGWALMLIVIYLLFAFVISNVFLLNTVKEIEAGASVESAQPNRFLLYLAYLPIVYVLSRLSVLYPAISVDRPVTAKGAWQVTAGNGWRMAIVIGLLPVALYFLLNLLLRENATVVEHMIHRLVGFILLAVQVVALSFTYKHLTEEVAPPASGL